MSIAKKLKWKRILSRLRFNYEELDLIKEVSRETAQDFQKYYEQYCTSRGIDISKLNNEHRERVSVLYDVGKTIPDKHDDRQSEVDPTGDTAVALHSGASKESNEKQKEHQMTTDEIAVHEAFSKLFKRIALKIHPDRLSANTPPIERESMLSMFQNANKSFEQKKYYVLLDIAAQLDITTPKNFSQQVRWMKRENAVIEQEINKQKSTYNFIFSEAETDEERDRLIKSFVQQVFQLDIQ